MSNTKVSVIIPFYNIEKCLLDRSVDSVLHQIYPDFECLIVNDGSKEEYASFLDDYKEMDSRIRILYKENGGLGNTRNYGVSEARGGTSCF